VRARQQVQDVDGIVERLLGFLETGKSYVTDEAVIQIKDLLRRYPTIAEACLASVSSIAPEVANQAPKESVVRSMPPPALAGRHILLRVHLVVDQDVVEPEARAAFIWILGEYGHRIQVSRPSYRHAPSEPSHRRCMSCVQGSCMGSQHVQHLPAHGCHWQRQGMASWVQ
jgi:hypothetical protein